MRIVLPARPGIAAGGKAFASRERAEDRFQQVRARAFLAEQGVEKAVESLRPDGLQKTVEHHVEFFALKHGILEAIGQHGAGLP